MNSTSNQIDKSQVEYIGDDLNDLPPMHLCGWIACPANSAKEIKSIADYVSTISSGHGTVRDCIEHLIGAREWQRLTANIYGIGGM